MTCGWYTLFEPMSAYKQALSGAVVCGVHIAYIYIGHIMTSAFSMQKARLPSSDFGRLLSPFPVAKALPLVLFS